MIEKELEKNKIALPLGTTGPSFNCHYLAYSQSKKHTRKINIFKEWIMEELNKSCCNFP